MRHVAMRSARMLTDLALLSLAFWAAVILRFDGQPDYVWVVKLLPVWPVVILVRYTALSAFRVPRTSWRYVSLPDLTRLYLATGSGTVVLLIVRLFVEVLDVPVARDHLLPYGVLAIDAALAFLALTGARVTRRMATERAESRRRMNSSRRDVPTVLIGAGQAGVMVARELAARPDLNIRPVGFLDDHVAKVGQVIYGLPVLGTTAALARVIHDTGAEQVLITIANAPGSEIRRITGICERAGVHAKIIPGVYEIVGGHVNLSRIRDVAITDLLRREAVELDMDAIHAQLTGAVVMVTGAGGSIGSELARQIARFEPRQLVLVEQAENPLFDIQHELLENHPELDAQPVIADITDAARMDDVIATYAPKAIFHAAAHKHVPLMEQHPAEAVKNNTLGTRLLADLAHRHQVETFVTISTDKAVNPSSVMGASKRAAEMYVQALARHSTTHFITVRFGNVLGSAGSVVPTFRRQIRRGGPVTVTHPEMTRYFMTIPEACQLVLQAGSMGQGGEIFILDMGDPVRILDLACDLIRLSGLRPYEDIDIVYSGLRPGEKLHEELSLQSENVAPTTHPKILVGRTTVDVSLAQLAAEFATLRERCDEGDPARVRSQLALVVEEYQAALTSRLAPVYDLQVEGDPADRHLGATAS